MTFYIHESNIDRLEKKLKTIESKCNKFGFHFKYERNGEVFHPVMVNGKPTMSKFYVVEVEGTANIDGWKFVGTIERPNVEKPSNIIHQVSFDVILPPEYRTCELICEHCNSNRNRKKVCILQNIETGEFKLIGTGCLKDYTGGLNAEMAATYMQYFEEVTKAYEPLRNCNPTQYFNVNEILRFYIETVNHYGFVSANYADATKYKGKIFRDIFNHDTEQYSDKEVAKYTNMMKQDDININRPETIERAEEMVSWLLNKPDENLEDFFHNLKVICSNEYCRHQDLGILAAFPSSYDKEMEREAAQKARDAANAIKRDNSSYLGNIGEKVTVSVNAARLITSFETQFGYTHLYEFIDVEGNVLIWYASSSKNIDGVTSVTGTVKKHDDYEGIKQTVLTRCKLS